LTAIFVAAAAVVIAPWPLRNWKQFGVPIVTTTHGGYTLLLANNPSFYEYLRTGPWGGVWDAQGFHEQWEAESNKTLRSSGTVIQRDELAADRRAYELAWNNIRNEPAMFAYSCLVRIGRLWAVLSHQTSAYESPSRRGWRYSVAIWYTAEMALATLGLWTLKRKLLASPWLWGVLLAASFTLVHACYWTDMRMRAPLVIVVALLAAVGVMGLTAKRRDVTPLPSKV
jgi:predicted outer membrane lipoprotein